MTQLSDPIIWCWFGLDFRVGSTHAHTCVCVFHPADAFVVGHSHAHRAQRVPCVATGIMFECFVFGRVLISPRLSHSHTTPACHASSWGTLLVVVVLFEGRKV
jgi:hypothetical protein